jgi:hypothetical protein
MANNTTVKISLTDAVLKIGTVGGSLPATTVVTTVENVSLKISKEKSPALNRLSQIKQYISTLTDVALEINFPADSADPFLAAFRSAAITNTPLPVYVAGTFEGANTRFTGIMGVESMEDDEPLAGVEMEKFTLFPWAVGYSGTQPGFTAA